MGGFLEQRRTKNMLYTAIWLLSSAGFAAFGITYLNVPKFYRLAKDGMSIEGWVVAKEPLNHQTVRYSYVIGTQTNHGAGNAGNGNPPFDQLNIGDPVRVSFNPNSPSESYLGDPTSELSSLTRGVILIALFPTVVVFAYSIQRRKKR